MKTVHEIIWYDKLRGYRPINDIYELKNNNNKRVKNYIHSGFVQSNKRLYRCYETKQGYTVRRVSLSDKKGGDLDPTGTLNKTCHLTSPGGFGSGVLQRTTRYTCGSGVTTVHSFGPEKTNSYLLIPFTGSVIGRGLRSIYSLRWNLISRRKFGDPLTRCTHLDLMWSSS